MPTNLGMPKTLIEFLSSGLQAIIRSQRGIVCVLLEDTVTTEKSIFTYRNLAEVSEADWDDVNYARLELIFKASPFKVIAVKTTSVSAGLATIKGLYFQWLVAPTATVMDKTAITSWIASQRLLGNLYKAVLTEANTADSEAIVNFSASGIKVMEGDEEIEISAADYACRVAGILAALPMNRSITYSELPEMSAIDNIDDKEGAVNAGKLLIFHDGEKFKFGRGVTSFTSITPTKGEEFCKIKLMEGMDQIKRDITYAFDNYYVGKVLNSYQNKKLFCGVVLAYFRELARPEVGVLDNTNESFIIVSYEKNKAWLQSHGKYNENMTELQVLTYPTGANAMFDGNIYLVDAMEDLDLSLFLGGRI